MNCKRRFFLPGLLIFCALTLAACGEGGFSWRLYGWETHRFTVDDEEISLRLDTSGSGRYEVALRENDICVVRNGVAVLEGGFWDSDEVAAFMEEVLSSEDYRVIEKSPEDAPSLLLYCYCAGDEPEYAFLTFIENSKLGAVFSAPLGSSLSEDEAAEYAHRVRITKSG